MYMYMYFKAFSEFPLLKVEHTLRKSSKDFNYVNYTHCTGTRMGSSYRVAPFQTSPGL